MHSAGVAILAYFLVELIFQAWPVALLQPAWLDKMIGFLVSRGITPLTGAILVAGASVLNPHSKQLASRATLLRRLASWVAMGYLLLIPVQIYSGVKLLQARKQESSQLIAQAASSVEAIRKATTPAELRRAYEQIPGNKPALPEQLPQPFPVIRERLAEGISANTKRAEYELGNKMSSLWQRSLGLALANTLRMLIFFLGFAAIGRRSPDHSTLLESLLVRNQRRFGKATQRGRGHHGDIIAKEWMDWEDDRPRS
ncbi:hypothetical protein KBZ33_13830 [Cyanobium sp. Cruz-8D1]|uniref:hypothetical protein n=1 Tax=Cyanobium sp. Cruz-8D1 TaxID=2823711 RepID=UPI0020CCA311|nr:hypothetical protein [Cyanobium sp. Cruz-8D1]MCP9859535.1 hypothetical protein [Cyanobium sp. Cruz-8H5]MCP9867362.1 hypothetical protein [Cyanobium sp. Cruz-8D1]